MSQESEFLEAISSALSSENVPIETEKKEESPFDMETLIDCDNSSENRLFNGRFQR